LSRSIAEIFDGLSYFLNGGSLTAVAKRGAAQINQRRKAPVHKTSATERQQSILCAIHKHTSEHGYAPTLRELCSAVGLINGEGMRNHLARMKKKGLVAYDYGKARTLRVLVPL
jgi:hypothetical protein